MKSLGKALAVTLLTTCYIGSNSVFALAEEIPFKDVPLNHWGYSHIQWAVEQDVVDGYSDGTFKPKRTVTQSEFLTMLIRAANPKVIPDDSSTTPWEEPYITYAQKLGWKATSPKKKLTRGLAAQLLANATGKNYDLKDSIQYMLDLGLAQGISGKNIEGYQANQEITRAEAVTLIERFSMKYNELHNVSPSLESYSHADLFHKYTNSTYHFRLEIPKSWDTRYEVRDQSVSNGHHLNFINTMTQGTLFTISVWSKNDWAEQEEEIKGQIPAVQVGERGNQVYVFHTPTDVQYDPSDDNAKIDYQGMFLDVQNIKSSFQISDK